MSLSLDTTETLMNSLTANALVQTNLVMRRTHDTPLNEKWEVGGLEVPGDNLVKLIFMLFILSKRQYRTSQEWGRVVDYTRKRVYNNYAWRRQPKRLLTSRLF